MRNHDIGGTNDTFTILAQLKNSLVTVMQLEDDTLEVQQNINNVFLHTIDRRIFVQNAVYGHLGCGKARHRRKKDAPQRIAKRMPETTLERLHHNLGVYR